MTTGEPITKTLPVRQLTAREAADFLDSIRAGFRIHAIDILMDGHPVPSPLVFAATGTDYDSFPVDIPPDDLPALFDEVQRLNPFLTGAAKRQMDRQITALDELVVEMERLEAKRRAETTSENSASISSSSASMTP